MRIKIDQQAVKITSIITNEELKKAHSFAPKALSAFDEKGNQVYMISASERPEIGMNYASFNGHDAEGYLTISMTIPMEADPEARLEEFKLAFGKQLAALAKHESTIKAQISNQVGEIDAAFNNIELL